MRGFIFSSLQGWCRLTPSIYTVSVYIRRRERQVVNHPRVQVLSSKLIYGLSSKFGEEKRSDPGAVLGLMTVSDRFLTKIWMALASYR